MGRSLYASPESRAGATGSRPGCETAASSDAHRFGAYQADARENKVATLLMGHTPHQAEGLATDGVPSLETRPNSGMYIRCRPSSIPLPASLHIRFATLAVGRHSHTKAALRFFSAWASFLSNPLTVLRRGARVTLGSCLSVPC